MKYHYLPVPADIAETLMASGTRRVLVTINDVVENRAIHNTADGEYFLVMGLSALRSVNAKPGDVVIASIVTDPNPEIVEIPEELLEALRMDQAASDRFYSMTPGQQRSIASYVTQVKRPASRIRRAMEIAYKMSSYTLHGDTHNNEE